MLSCFLFRHFRWNHFLCPDLWLSGRCDPEDLKIVPPPPQLPVPSPGEEDEDGVTEIDAELLWESQPHPPRGDVPGRRPYLDYGEVEPQDQAVPGDSLGGHTGDRDAWKVSFTRRISRFPPVGTCCWGWILLLRQTLLVILVFIVMICRHKQNGSFKWPFGAAFLFYASCTSASEPAGGVQTQVAPQTHTETDERRKKPDETLERWEQKVMQRYLDHNSQFAKLEYI